MDRQEYGAIEAYMLTCMKDSAHDKDHVYRVLYNALAIARQEGDMDMDVLVAACLLHDIGRPDQIADPSLCHAQVGAERAYAFLRERGWTADRAEHVRRCIRTHRFRKGDVPQSLEARILYDADKLDVTGADAAIQRRAGRTDLHHSGGRQHPGRQRAGGAGLLLSGVPLQAGAGV